MTMMVVATMMVMVMAPRAAVGLRNGRTDERKDGETKQDGIGEHWASVMAKQARNLKVPVALVAMVLVAGLVSSSGTQKEDRSRVYLCALPTAMAPFMGAI